MSAPPAPAAGLTLGTLHVPTPVVLAPMAGITNAAYRRLCAEQGAGLYVCEMITSRGLVEGDQHTKDMLVFDELETTRSVQLYGTDPVYVGKAAEILCAEYGVAHIDLNFGCPVPKVTRKGGGGALPWKRGLLADILEHAVRAATPYDVPVTMKTRKGIDEDHLTYLDAGRIAQESGCAAIALHGRTVAQAYSGRADWDAIGELAASVDIPVLGNGDIWEAADALRMVEETGAAGVVVGRGTDADVRINDPGVSRQHVEFRVEAAADRLHIDVRDLGSTNGMLVDGQKMTRSVADDGTQVTIGNTVLTVKVVPEDV